LGGREAVIKGSPVFFAFMKDWNGRVFIPPFSQWKTPELAGQG